MWENIAFIIGFTVQDYGKIRHGLTFKCNDEITGLKPTYNSQEAKNNSQAGQAHYARISVLQIPKEWHCMIQCHCFGIYKTEMRA